MNGRTWNVTSFGPIPLQPSKRKVVWGRYSSVYVLKHPLGLSSNCSPRVADEACHLDFSPPWVAGLHRKHVKHEMRSFKTQTTPPQKKKLLYLLWLDRLEVTAWTVVIAKGVVLLRSRPRPLISFSAVIRRLVQTCTKSHDVPSRVAGMIRTRVCHVYVYDTTWQSEARG